MQQQIVGDIKITPAEVRRYFKDLPQDSIPFIPTQVEVQIITMEPKIPQEEIERVKKTLRDYTERVTSGEIAFSTLARLYSEDEGSRRRGGELGFMGRADWYLNMRMWHSICKILTRYPRLWSLNSASILSS